MPDSTIVCPECAYDIPSASDFCPFCGAKIKKEKKLCPNCGIELSESDKICPGCGIDLADKRCANCGSKLREIDVFCPKCGTKCESAAGAAPAEAPASPRKRIRYTCRSCLHHSFDLTSPHCPSCGGPVALVCPECGSLNKFGAKRCSFCGYVIPDDTPASSASAPMPDKGILTEKQKSTLRYICQSCGHRQFGLKENRCLVCGGTVSSICFHCGELNPFGVEICEHCGNPIASDAVNEDYTAGAVRPSGYPKPIDKTGPSAVPRTGYPYEKTTTSSKDAAAKAAAAAQYSKADAGMKILVKGAVCMLILDIMLFFIAIAFSGEASVSRGGSDIALFFSVYKTELIIWSILGLIGNIAILANNDPFKYYSVAMADGAFNLIKGGLMLMLVIVRRNSENGKLLSEFFESTHILFGLMVFVAIIQLFMGILMLTLGSKDK